MIEIPLESKLEIDYVWKVYTFGGWMFLAQRQSIQRRMSYIFQDCRHSILANFSALFNKEECLSFDAFMCIYVYICVCVCVSVFAFMCAVGRYEFPL